MDRSIRELQCLEKAHEARIASARRRLEDLRKNGVPFDSPLSGFSVGIDWKDEPRERTKQILFMPIAFFLVVFLALMVPVMYILHLLEVQNQKRSLKTEIAGENIKPTNTETPTIKTLESLWQLHGLNEYKYSSAERLELLSKWIEILYGKKIAEGLNLNQRVEAIAIRHVEANRPYYEGKSEALHFSFVSPVDSLMRELSEELPEYDQSVAPASA